MKTFDVPSATASNEEARENLTVGGKELQLHDK